jgi:hypothetical protein
LLDNTVYVDWQTLKWSQNKCLTCV